MSDQRISPEVVSMLCQQVRGSNGNSCLDEGVILIHVDPYSGLSWINGATVELGRSQGVSDKQDINISYKGQCFPSGIMGKAVWLDSQYHPLVSGYT